MKFLFATTEVNKVPVTVLSRCQRFDLRRIPAELLAAHFGHVAQMEGVEVEPEALALVARAAEGSARDGLSILDQAIAHGAGAVTAEQVRAMLGLSDRGATRAILAQILAGDAPGTLAAVRDQYDLGVEPSALIRGLLEAVHGITRAKVGGAGDLAQSAEEREAYADWASRLGHGAIHRLWQLLLKGLNEVHNAPMPLEAAEMALLRVIHAADLPDPGAVLEKLASGEAVAAAAPAPGAPKAESQGALLQLPPSFAALVELLEDKGKAHIAQQLHDYVGLVELRAARADSCGRSSPCRAIHNPQRRRGAEGGDRNRLAGPHRRRGGAAEPARPAEGGGRPAAAGGARRADRQGGVRGLPRGRAGGLQDRRTTECVTCPI